MKSVLAFTTVEGASRQIEITTSDMQGDVAYGNLDQGVSLFMYVAGSNDQGIHLPFNQLAQLIALLQVHLEAGQPQRRRR